LPIEPLQQPCAHLQTAPLTLTTLTSLNQQPMFSQLK
jgi:hypothetical protein